MQIAVRQWETQEQAERLGKHAGKHAAGREEHCAHWERCGAATMRPMMRFNRAQWAAYGAAAAKALTLCGNNCDGEGKEFVI